MASVKSILKQREASRLLRDSSLAARREHSLRVGGSLQADLSHCLMRAARQVAPGLTHEEAALLAWLARLAQPAQPPLAKCA